ncbi:SGNH/GDSL hydrolase family protein [Candidatus Pacebacteria bacterium]|nr:SGNH/GDSL hydrolase family protein [Candidatus Paceibacterota bacterium]
MKAMWIIGIAVSCIAIALWFFGPRLVKTVWLIARISPFERTIKDAPSILILGDSTGYGTGATRGSESIAGLIAADFPTYSIANNSENGRTIGELVPVSETVTQQYELILLQIGGNDILQKRDPAVVESELRTIVSNLAERTTHLVMMSSGNVGGASAFSGKKGQEYEAITRTYRALFMEVALDTPLTYIDLFLEPENDPFVTNPKKYLSADGLHPSSAGYAQWYQSLQPVLTNKLTSE